MLPSELPALRRVPPGLLHLTLAFLGSVGPEAVGPAREALRAAARSAEPFPVRLRGLGRFPITGTPAVVWLGADRRAPELGELVGRVRAELAALDLPFDDGPFRPHVTLARVRRRPGAAGEGAIARVVGGPSRGRLDFLAERVHLVESVLARTGARYRLVEEAMLGGGSGRTESTAR